MKETAMRCPKCDSSSIIKNGSISNGKKKFLCKECSRQFVECPERRRISDSEWRIVDRLLLEKISIAGIARAVSISKRWLHEYIKKNGMKSEGRLSACQRMGKFL
jgi:transposase-like protein